MVSRLATIFVTGFFVIGSLASAGAAEWQRLGQQYVDYRSNPVAIEATPNASAVSRIKLQVKECPLEIQAVKIYLAGGESFDATLNAYVGPGRETRVIEIPDGPKTIEKVELTYRGQSRAGRLPLVRLLGAS